MKGIFFSVIIAANGSDHETENTLNSIFEQGMSDNIQVILVGKEDAISSYPSNHTKEVIRAVVCDSDNMYELWNIGKQHADGDFINFIASGNCWEKDSFHHAYDLIAGHKSTPLILCRTKHMKDHARFTDSGEFRFNKDNLIDTDVRYSYLIDSIQQTFINKEFATSLDFITDDAKVASNSKPTAYGKAAELLFAKELLSAFPTYYVSKKSVFLNNEINESIAFKADTFDTWLNKVCPQLLATSDRNTPSRYNQHAAAWIIKELVRNHLCALNRDEVTQFKTRMTELLQVIEDRVLWNISSAPYSYRTYLLKLKHGGDNFDRNIFLKRFKAEVSIATYDEGMLHLEGIDKAAMAGDGCKLIIKDSKGHEYLPEICPAACYDDKTFDGKCALEGKIWKIDLPAMIHESYGFYLKNALDQLIQVNAKFTKRAPFTNAMESTYFFEGDRLFKYAKSRIHVSKADFFSVWTAENHFCNELKSKHKEELIPFRKKAVAAKLKKKGKSKETWLISDRTNIAGDNGEAFYRFLCNIPEAKEYDIYFVIDKNGRGYDKVADLPNIVDYSSDEYKLKFLTCDKIISSQKADWVMNAFGSDREYMKNLYTYKFCFLQHGIIRNDMSRDFHKIKLNVHKFITSVESERNKIIELYGYDESQVVLTGLARYDRLQDEKTNIITFLPTWRQYIEIPTKTGISNRPYSENFTRYEYYRFYNSLINDVRILKAMRDNKYTGEFYVHPLFEAQACDFTGNDVIKVNTATADYQKVFKESSLLVTDYSSVDFDFAYLKKPIVYTMFDKELFFGTHTSNKTFFDYDNDGFGPACYDYETSVKAIVGCIENGCALEEKYAENIDKFFYYHDKNNCQRIFDAIKES